MISAATTSALSLISSASAPAKSGSGSDLSATILASANGVSPEVEGGKKAFAGTVFDASLNMRETESEVRVLPGGGLVITVESTAEAVSILRSEIEAVGRGEGTFNRSKDQLRAMIKSYENLAQSSALTAEMIADYNSPEQVEARAKALKQSAEGVMAAYREVQFVMKAGEKAGFITNADERLKGWDAAYAYEKQIYDDLVKAGY